MAMVEADLTSYGVIASAVVFVFSVWMVREFAAPKTPLLVLLVVLLSWFLTFTSLSFLLPLDAIASSSSMQPLWTAVYWTSFGLTWFVIPLVQSYYEAGEFTPRKRVWASVRANLLFYVIAGVVAGALMVYFGVKNRLGFSEVLGILICLSQVWGLTFCVLLLGTDPPRKSPPPARRNQRAHALDACRLRIC